MARRKWTKEEIAEYRKKNGSLGYFNKEDSNLFVPKAYGIGRTMNWAHPISWVLVIVLICLIVFKRFI